MLKTTKWGSTGIKGFFRGGLAVVTALSLVASLPAGQKLPQDLMEASLEDLMKIQVTSVAKKEQMLSKVGAAIYVISQEDIRRSGATNIPDVLRMAPGVEVSQIDANIWAVSIRGFNNRYGDKVLVLVDGRSVYTPIFSGVRWDEQNTPLENIERIEVIRGPGGAVWGANAMNGVINIITKSSHNTQGALVRVGGGSERNADAFLQYGGGLGRMEPSGHGGSSSISATPLSPAAFGPRTRGAQPAEECGPIGNCPRGTRSPCRAESSACGKVRPFPR